MGQRFHSNSPGNNNQVSMTTTNDKLRVNKF